MRSLSSRRPSTAVVLALMALVIALGGTSYAAFSVPKNSVGTKQLKNRAVTTHKLGNRAVKTKQIANRAVTGAKLNLSGVTVPTASNANDLGGSPASAYREEWALVSPTGSVVASSGGITTVHAFPGGYYVKFPDSQLNHGISLTKQWTTGQNQRVSLSALICTLAKQGGPCDPPANNDSRYVFVEIDLTQTSHVDRPFYIVSTP